MQDWDSGRGGEGRVQRYLCELAQRVLQHLHSEDEGPLRQDLAVSISQIFPAGTRGAESQGHTALLGGTLRCPLPICPGLLSRSCWGSGFSPTNLCIPGPLRPLPSAWHRAAERDGERPTAGPDHVRCVSWTLTPPHMAAVGCPWVLRVPPAPHFGRAISGCLRPRPSWRQAC